MPGPGYTVKDLVYYSGLFGGICLVYVGTRQVAIHHILRLIISIVAGLGLGWAALSAYESSRQKNPPRDDDF